MAVMFKHFKYTARVKAARLFQARLAHICNAAITLVHIADNLCNFTNRAVGHQPRASIDLLSELILLLHPHSSMVAILANHWTTGILPNKGTISKWALNRRVASSGYA